MKNSIRQVLGSWLALCLIMTSISLAADESRVVFLIDKLRNSLSFKVRLKAAVMLGRMSDARAVSPLCEALRDDNYIVRGAAARALGNLGYPKAVRAVDKLFGLATIEEETFVREEVLRALNKLVGEDSLDAYVRALSDDDTQIRLTAVRVLASMDTFRAKEAMLVALGDEVEAVRSEAAQALKNFPANEVKQLIKTVFNNKQSSRVQLEAIRLAGELEMGELLENLSELLVRDDIVPDVKIATTQVIARMKDKIDLSSVIRQVTSKDKLLRDKAIYLLGILGGKQAVDTLIGLLQHEDEYIRRRAVNALHDAGDPRAAPVLEKMLNTESNPRALESIQRTLKKLQQGNPG